MRRGSEVKAANGRSHEAKSLRPKGRKPRQLQAESVLWREWSDSDPKVLWQMAEKGILKSEDGAATWQPVDLPVANAQIVSIAAPSAQVCWLVGRDSLILLTTDGAHWQTVAPPAKADFVHVVAENAFSATVATAEGLRFQTGDGGKHWHSVP